MHLQQQLRWEGREQILRLQNIFPCNAAGAVARLEIECPFHLAICGQVRLPSGGPARQQESARRHRSRQDLLPNGGDRTPMPLQWFEDVERAGQRGQIRVALVLRMPRHDDLRALRRPAPALVHVFAVGPSGT